MLIFTKTTAGDDIDVTPEDSPEQTFMDQIDNKITSMDGMTKQCNKQDKRWLSPSSDLAWYSSNYETVSLLQSDPAS